MSHTTTVKSVPIKDVAALHASVAALVASGVRCELIPNAVPRMYYADQIGKHMQTKQPDAYHYHANPEECDYVLKLHDAYYDVGFLRNKEGHLVPLFDDYNHPSHNVRGSTSGRGPIREFIGAEFAGEVEHWSGQRDDTEQTLHSIGRLLQGYSTHAAINAAVSAGYMVTGQTTDEHGNVHLLVAVD